MKGQSKKAVKGIISGTAFCGNERDDDMLWRMT